MDFQGLPEVNFVEYDPAVIEARMIAACETKRRELFIADGYTEAEAVAEAKLHPGDPERLFTEAPAAESALIHYGIDYAAKQNTLAYAENDYLDHVTALHGELGKRLGKAAAKCTMRFSLSEARAVDTDIEIETLVSPDGLLMFATTEATVIPAGETYVDVEAACRTEGVKGNGYLAGEINLLVETIPYVTTVTNTTESQGGTDRETDDHLRARAWTAPLAYSTCGPKGAYIYMLQSVSPDSLDQEAETTDLGVITCWLLMSGGRLPTAEELATAEGLLDQDTRMPDGFEILVRAPEEVTQDLILTYYVYQGYSSLLAQIQEQVAQVIEEYRTWQTQEKLGRDFLPTELIASLRAITGLKRVEVESPVYQALGPGQIARFDIWST